MKDSLILRCCVDFPFGNYFPCSCFKEYYPQISVDVLTVLIDSACHPDSKRRIPRFCDAALTSHLEIIFHAQVSKGITPKSVLTCWRSWLTALATQLAKEGYPDFPMLRWLSLWKLFSILRFQRVWPPNQCWRVDILDWQHLLPSWQKKYTLILRCCVDFPFGNYFPCSSFKGYDPQISVDVLTFLIDSTFHPVGKRSIPWFCDAALTFHLEIIFHAQVSKGMTPKSVLMCWHSWLTALSIQLAKEVCHDCALLCWQSAQQLFSMLKWECECESEKGPNIYNLF